ncbi:uncharacterized protein EV422DRAFT_10629 [Fimicolochytrium jonesii]|uniref:uncharacterized protein n=1 Tax=Fimicolochytrium jonesii TaxID=1396493 RepID=UPI0022FEE25A|nr:uncharacterized protein EV422DRAFT_10629 [Fimicolochytrium jonesii]KAI8826778.1 hypothetical protein EV422DRAFT_10629 [Fimicolochytrium jonesii]
MSAEKQEHQQSGNPQNPSPPQYQPTTGAATHPRSARHRLPTPRQPVPSPIYAAQPQPQPYPEAQHRPIAYNADGTPITTAQPRVYFNSVASGNPVNGGNSVIPVNSVYTSSWFNCNHEFVRTGEWSGGDIVNVCCVFRACGAAVRQGIRRNTSDDLTPFLPFQITDWRKG